MRADFFRYLAIYVLGGIYADSDTNCFLPVKKWIGTTEEMVIAPEALRNGTDTSDLIEAFLDDKKVEHYIQWAFAAMPRHPAIWNVIQTVIARVNAPKEELRARIPHLVCYITGPAAFTDGLRPYLNKGESSITVRLPILFGGMEPFYQRKFAGSWPARVRELKAVQHLYGSTQNADTRNWIEDELKMPLFVDSNFPLKYVLNLFSFSHRKLI